MNTQEVTQFDPVTNENVNAWLQGAYDEETKSEIRRLLQEKPKEVLDGFYTHLSFGTGGLRGLMGIGTNRLNTYTVRAATQGLANYLRRQSTADQDLSVFLGYDSRHHSREFAEEAAKVLAANGIHVYLTKALRPTPLVSFGCRFKKCSAAIMITASHNPPSYNGYKVYWSDGGQVLPPHDIGIIKEINQIRDPIQVKALPSLADPHIQEVTEEIDHAYLKAISSLQLSFQETHEHGSEIRIVYTSLHGTGITLVPQILTQWGFTQVHFVAEQVIPNGNFPTCSIPNPEEKAALHEGIEALKQTDSDILIATDPDADRVGVAIKHQGEVHLLDGNQIACICLEYICHTLSASKKLPERAAFIKTIGTSELFEAIATAYGKRCFNVLTGFKYIAEMVEKWEKDPNGYEFVFGGEESYGYLLGTKTRDKDGILASALICEVALHGKRQNKTLIDLLHDLWKKHGIYVEKLLSVKFEESKAGKEQMAHAMALLRTNPPTTIGGIEVLKQEDYALPTHLPASDVLVFWLADHTKIIVRPSGTEPKIKLYCGVVHPYLQNIEEGQRIAEFHAKKLLHEVQLLLQT